MTSYSNPFSIASPAPSQSSSDSAFDRLPFYIHVINLLFLIFIHLAFTLLICRLTLILTLSLDLNIILILTLCLFLVGIVT